MKTPPPPTAESPSARLPCPYLAGEVEWTEERERHIAERHPDLLPAHRACIEQTIADPDEVRNDDDYPNTRLFLRWYDDLLGGKNVVVAVVSAEAPEVRHWIVTAFIARRPPKRRPRMETPLTFEYDETGDILYISKVPPYPEQETEQLSYNVTVRRNPRTGAVENLEVLFFTRWLLKGGQQHFSGLGELFAEPGAAVA